MCYMLRGGEGAGSAGASARTRRWIGMQWGREESESCGYKGNGNYFNKAEPMRTFRTCPRHAELQFQISTTGDAR